MKKTTTSLLTAALAGLLAVAPMANASTILVNWGSAGGVDNITGVLVDGDAADMTGTYNTTNVVTQDGTAWYLSYTAGTDTPEFYGAASVSTGKVEVRSAGDGDYFSYPRNLTVGQSHNYMLAWNAGLMANSPAGLTLDTYSLEFKDRGASALGTMRLIIESAGSWYISDQQTPDSTSSYQSWTGSFSDLTWSAYTPHSGGTANIGATAIPSLTSISSVGIYGDVEEVASNWAELRTRFFQVTAVAIPEPSSTALLGLGGLAFALRRKRS